MGTEPRGCFEDPHRVGDRDVAGYEDQVVCRDDLEHLQQIRMQSLLGQDRDLPEPEVAMY